MKAAHPLPPEDLMAYLDGEVNGEEAHRIQAHLTACEACRQLAADLRQGSMQMKEWRIDGPPASLDAPRTRRSTERRSTWLHVARAWNPVTQRPLLAGTAVVVLIAAMIAMQPLQRSRVSSVALSGRVAEPREMPETIVNDLRNAAPMMAPRGFQQTGAQGLQGGPARQVEAGPRIVRTATLRIVATDFGRIRPAVDRILQGVGGFVGDITAYDKPGSARSLRGTLRIPSAQFGAALAQLRGLGRVTEDSQNAEDVTATVVDLDVRLANGRVTEKRLSQVLLNRTGGVADVLEVEREIGRVRTDIEQLEAQRTQLARRIEYGTVTLEIVEEQPAAVMLGPVPIPTRLSHAIADGVEAAAISMLDVTLFVLRAGPVTLLWVTVLGLPWWFFRRQTTRTS